MDQYRAVRKILPREQQRFGNDVVPFGDGDRVDQEAGPELAERLDLDVRHLRATAGDDRGQARWPGSARRFWLDLEPAGYRQPSDQS
nr:hypothetical protein [uncultured Arthrobacter sp.]